MLPFMLGYKQHINEKQKHQTLYRSNYVSVLWTRYAINIDINAGKIVQQPFAKLRVFLTRVIVDIISR